MKRFPKIIIAAMMLIGAASLAFAGGVQEETFLEKLEDKLAEEGLTDEEVAEFMEAAEAIDWDEVENSNPSVVAKSLVELKRENDGLEAQEQARIAHAFATELRKMEEEGTEEGEDEGSEISQVAQQAVEELKEQIRQWQEEGEEEQLGELVRNIVRERVQKAVQEKKQNKNQKGPSEDSQGSEGDDDSEGSGVKGLDKAAEKAPQSKSGN